MRRSIAPIALFALAGLLMLPARASDPSSATVSASSSRVDYQGGTISANPPAVTRRVCVDGQNCDSFALTVDVPDTFYASNDRVLSATITWASKSNDLDLYVCKGTQASDPQCLGGLQASSTKDGTTQETVVLANPEAGAYRIIAAANGGSTSYTGAITFLAPPAVPVARNLDNGFGWRAQAVSNASPYGEPSIDVDHANNVFVTAPGGPGVQMWRSFDGGFSFSHKEIASPGGGGDSEVEFSLNDTGYTADLRITDSAVSRSTNGFKTWTQQGVGIEQDRQWLAHRCERSVFLGYHDFVAEAEVLSRSDDGGKSWNQVPVFISPKGSAPGNQDAKIYADQSVNTFSGPVVVDQKTGDIYIVFAISSFQGNLTTGTPPYGDPEQIVVGVSRDEGKTFDLKLVREGGPGSLAGVIFPWITLDRDGNVYVSWAGRQKETEDINVFLTHSTDHGSTWATPARINTDDGHAHIYTTISAGDPGVVDMAWYTSTKPDPSDPANDWFVDFAQVRSANTSAPLVEQSRVYASSIHHGDICLNGLLCVTGGDRSLLDFFQIQVGPDGIANIAFANNASPDGTQRIWYARQVDGASAGNALHDSTYCAKAAGTAPTDGNAAPPPATKVLGNTASRDLPATGVGEHLLLALALLIAAAAMSVSLHRARA